MLIGIGIYYSRRALSSEDDYWVAGRSVNSFVGSFAIFAAVASGSSLYGSIGLGWRFGVTYYLCYGLSAISLFPFALFIFAAQMRRSGVRTLPEYFNRRYGKSVHLLSAAIVVFFMTLYIIPQLTASGYIGSYVLGLPYTTAVVLIGIGFTIYAAIGGMWAITYTDFIQGLLMVGGSALLGLIVLGSHGGYANLVADAVAANPNFTTINLPWMSFFGLFFIFLWFAVVAPSAVMRNLTGKDAGVARRSMMGATWFYTIMWIFGLFILTAAVGLNAPGTLERADYAYLTVVEAYMPPLLAGILLAAILASIMSSTDSFLLAVSAGISQDIYKGHINKVAPERLVTRIGLVVMFVAAIFAIIVALNPVELITVMVAWVSGGMVAAFAFPIILGLWWRRANTQGAFAGMLGGFVSYIIFMLTKPFELLSEVLVATPIALVIMVVVTLLTPAPSEEVQREVEKQHQNVISFEK